MGAKLHFMGKPTLPEGTSYKFRVQHDGVTIRVLGMFVKFRQVSMFTVWFFTTYWIV